MPPEHSQEITFGIPQAGGVIPTGSEDLVSIWTKYCSVDMILMQKHCQLSTWSLHRLLIARSSWSLCRRWLRAGRSPRLGIDRGASSSRKHHTHHKCQIAMNLSGVFCKHDRFLKELAGTERGIPRISLLNS